MTTEKSTTDHSLFSADVYREIDAELAAAEREMEDADAQLAAWHERQANKKKQGKLFG